MKISDVNTDFNVISFAKSTRDWQTVNESSLNRAYQHAKNGHFGIITNYRAGRTPAENRAGFSELKARLRQIGLGPIVLLGHWRECQDPTIPYDECPPEQLKDVIEPSLFVPNIDFGTITKLASDYDQDAAVYAGPETGGEVMLMSRDGSMHPIGSFHPNKISRAYSELPGKKGKTFVFEYIVQSHIEALIEQNLKKHS